MKTLAAILIVLALLAGGCTGGGFGLSNIDIDVSPKASDLTGTWSGNIGEVAQGTFKITQTGTNLVLTGERGYYAKGTNQAGIISLTDRFGNEIPGFVWKENEITFYGPDEKPGKLVRL